MNLGLRVGRIVSIAGALLIGSAVLAGCGASKSSTDSSADSTSKSDVSKVPVESDQVNGVIGTLLQGVTGARGDKVDGPGKVRFLNLLTMGGKAVDVDIYWGQPDEGAKAGSAKFGTAINYLTPKMAKGFHSAVYSVTAKGDTKVLWSWDRFTPTKETVRTVVFMPTNDGASVSETDLDEQIAASGFSSKVEFPAADAGMVRLYWRPLGRSIDSTDQLLSVTDGTKCFTNGSGLAGPDGNAVNGNTFQVKPGTVLSLSTYGACDKQGVASVTVPPTTGRAILFAYVDASAKPVMLILPVA